MAWPKQALLSSLGAFLFLWWICARGGAAWLKMQRGRVETLLSQFHCTDSDRRETSLFGEGSFRENPLFLPLSFFLSRLTHLPWNGTHPVSSRSLPNSQSVLFILHSHVSRSRQITASTSPKSKCQCLFYQLRQRAEQSKIRGVVQR